MPLVPPVEVAEEQVVLLESGMRLVEEEQGAAVSLFRLSLWVVEVNPNLNLRLLESEPLEMQYF